MLVIDELPYWMAHSPQLPGLLQLLYDRSQAGEGPAGGRIIMCGSAMSVMDALLSGTKALRGRTAVDLRVNPFDLRTSTQHWKIDHPRTAMRVNAILGGSPGYRNLTSIEPPQDEREFDDWVVETVLNPGQALFSRSETEYLLREDPRFTGSTLHYSILGAVAAGASSPAKIGGLLERERTSLTRPLDNLTSAGFLRYDHDPLWQRRPVVTIADPIVRFHNLITVPQIDAIEAGRSDSAWNASRATFSSRILGPHFEECCREWMRRYAPVEVGREFGTVGATVVNAGSGRAKHEIDVIALRPELVTTAHERGDVLLADLATLMGLSTPVAGAKL